MLNCTVHLIHIIQLGEALFVKQVKERVCIVIGREREEGWRDGEVKVRRGPKPTLDDQ